MLKDNKTKGPYWTRNWIEAMWRFTNENFVDFDSGSVDFEALGKEEFEFRKALFFRNFKNSTRAKETFDAAKEEYQKKIENGKMGGRPRKNKEITEDAPAREDGDGLTDAGNGSLRNPPPSSGNSQDASTGNGEDGSLVRPATNFHHGAGMPRSATGIGGGRDAWVTMSPSPEGAVQSGKVYNDQETHTDKESTDASCNTATAKPIAATKTGGSALDMPGPDNDKQAQAPAYGGNRRQATETTTPLPKISKNDQETAESRKGRTRASNYSLSESVVDTDERVQSCEVLNLAYSGRNGLVVLSQEEYNRLLQETGNKKKADRLVDSLDYALAEGKEFNQKHINVLLHWKDYRDEKLIAAKYGKNFADRQDQMVRDNMQLAEDIRNGRIAL